MKDYSLQQIQDALGKMESCEQYKHQNQICARYTFGEALFSYGKLVAIHLALPYDKIHYFFTDFHDFSRTTSKHVTQWCSIDTKSRWQGLHSGHYGFITLK